MAYGATAEDLRHYVGRSVAFTEEQTTRATLLLDLAAGTVEDETGQSLELSEDTVVLDGPSRDRWPSQPGTGTRKLILPRWPVTAVASVTLTEDDELLVHGREEDYTWSAAGLITRRSGWWPAHEQAIEVTYTAGYTTIPNGVRRIILRLAGVGWSNPGQLTSETLGDLSRSWAAAELGMALNEADRRTLGYYRART